MPERRSPNRTAYPSAPMPPNSKNSVTNIPGNLDHHIAGRFGPPNPVWTVRAISVARLIAPRIVRKVATMRRMAELGNRNDRISNLLKM